MLGGNLLCRLSLRERALFRGAKDDSRLTPGSCGSFGASGVRRMLCRGVRGTTTVEANTREEILTAHAPLLALMIRVNGIEPRRRHQRRLQPDARPGRRISRLRRPPLGWLDVPLLCTYEVDVPGSLRRCVRVLIHWNTDKPQHEIRHVYIKDALKLRPDLSKLPRWISASWSAGSRSKWRNSRSRRRV